MRHLFYKHSYEFENPAVRIFEAGGEAPEGSAENIKKELPTLASTGVSPQQWLQLEGGKYVPSPKARELATKAEAEYKKILEKYRKDRDALFTEVFSEYSERSQFNAGPVEIKTEDGKGILEVLEAKGGKVAEAFKKYPALRLLAYAHMFQAFEASGRNVNFLPVGSTVKLEEGYVQVNYPGGDMTRVSLFPWPEGSVEKEPAEEEEGGERGDEEEMERREPAAPGEAAPAGEAAPTEPPAEGERPAREAPPPEKAPEGTSDQVGLTAEEAQGLEEEETTGMKDRKPVKERIRERRELHEELDKQLELDWDENVQPIIDVLQEKYAGELKFTVRESRERGGKYSRTVEVENLLAQKGSRFPRTEVRSPSGFHVEVLMGKRIKDLGAEEQPSYALHGEWLIFPHLTGEEGVYPQSLSPDVKRRMGKGHAEPLDFTATNPLGYLSHAASLALALTEKGLVRDLNDLLPDIENLPPERQGLLLLHTLEDLQLESSKATQASRVPDKDIKEGYLPLLTRWYQEIKPQLDPALSKLIDEAFKNLANQLGASHAPSKDAEPLESLSVYELASRLGLDNPQDPSYFSEAVQSYKDQTEMVISDFLQDYQAEGMRPFLKLRRKSLPEPAPDGSVKWNLVFNITGDDKSLYVRVSIPPVDQELVEAYVKAQRAANKAFADPEEFSEATVSRMLAYSKAQAALRDGLEKAQEERHLDADFAAYLKEQKDKADREAAPVESEAAGGTETDPAEDTETEPVDLEALAEALGIRVDLTQEEVMSFLANDYWKGAPVSGVVTPLLTPYSHERRDDLVQDVFGPLQFFNKITYQMPPPAADGSVNWWIEFSTKTNPGKPILVRIQTPAVDVDAVRDYCAARRTGSVEIVEANLIRYLGIQAGLKAITEEWGKTEKKHKLRADNEAFVAEYDRSVGLYHQASEEMPKLVRKFAWDEVEAKYQLLLSLRRKGVVLHAQDHLSGALAVKDRGDIKEALARLDLALTAPGDKTEALNYKTDLLSHFGQVSLSIRQGYLPVTGNKKPLLTATNTPWSTVDREAIVRAQEALSRRGRFDGYLPKGQYLFAGEEFSVTPGEPVQVIRMQGPGVRIPNPTE